MKLSKLYANKSDFKSIAFNDGVNIIIGRINNPDNLKTNAHNLGKSLIVKLIDYMLVKETKGNGYFDDDEFEGYTFYLEIKLNSGKYATIKRETQSNLVSIKLQEKKLDNLTSETKWDYENYSVNGKKNNAQKVLQDLLKFDILSDFKYRDSLTYFLRGQDDYNDPFQLSKYNRSKEIAWKPTLFELLGYDGSLLSKIFDLNEKIKNTKNEINLSKKQNDVKGSEIDKCHGIKSLIEKNIDDLSHKAEVFDFYLLDADISTNIVKDIEQKIAEYNVQSYSLKNEIANINESMECDMAFDYQDVYDLYTEMQMYFPEQLKKTYEELADFNKKITKERLNKLGELLKEKSDALNQIMTSLQELNSERIEALSKLQEVETFQKYKNSQKEIIVLNVKLSEINNKIEAIKIISEKNNEVAKDNKTLDLLKDSLGNQIKNCTDKGKDIKSNFQVFVKSIVGSDALLSIEPVSTGNINFKYDFLNAKGEPTKENNGHTYMKELCACMDLAIIKSYINNSYYRFTFHDGCLDGDDPKFAIAYLNLIKELAKEGLQCIVTMIDCVVPRQADGTTYKLDSGDLILELTDAPDGSGKLFGRNF